MRASSSRAPKRPTVRHAALVGAAAVALLVALNQLIPTVWYSPRIEARVVGPNGAPLANALVVANWNIVAPWTGASLGQLALAEVSTGPDGTFSIPAWGPRLTLHGSVTEEDPTLRIIKPGYQPRVIHNIVAGLNNPAGRVIRFRLQGQDIVLQPAGGAGDATALENLLDSAAVLCGSAPPPCPWREKLSSRARQPDPMAPPGQPGRAAWDDAQMMRR